MQNDIHPTHYSPFLCYTNKQKRKHILHVSSNLIPLAEIRSVASGLHFFPSLLTMYSDRTPYFI